MRESDERSVGQLVASLPDEMSTLVRSEIELAKAEATEAVQRAVGASAMFGIAGFLAYVAFLMLSVAAALGLVALGLHPALGFLLVAVAFLLVAAVLGLIGYRAIKKVGPPKRAIGELDRIKQTLRNPSPRG